MAKTLLGVLGGIQWVYTVYEKRIIFHIHIFFVYPWRAESFRKRVQV